MTRPNLLLFTPDQLRADALGCFGNVVAQTPNIDAFSQRGTRFNSAWSQHSVCGPSRVSMMTGWYPHTAGHRTLDHLLKPWEPNLLLYLKDSGYDVAMVGNRGDVFAPGVTEASTTFCGNLVKPSWGWRDITITTDEDHPLYRGFWFGKQGDEPRIDIDEAAIQTAIQWLQERNSNKPWSKTHGSQCMTEKICQLQSHLKRVKESRNLWTNIGSDTDGKISMMSI